MGLLLGSGDAGVKKASMSGALPGRMTIDGERFASEAVLQAWCDRIGGQGYRGTGTAAHERIIAWVEDELRAIAGITLRTDEYDVLRWQPVPEGDLERAAGLRVNDADVPVAGAVPYTLPASHRGPLVYLPPGTAITPEVADSCDGSQP